MRGAEAREAFSGASTGSTVCETRVETPETQRRARRRRAPRAVESGEVKLYWLGRSLVGQGAGGNPLMVCAITVQHRPIMNRQKQKERDFHPNW